MNFEKLEQIREDRQISVDDLAKKLGIHRSTWYRWIGGEHNPSIEKLLKACNIMGIDINDLVK